MARNGTAATGKRLARLAALALFATLVLTAAPALAADPAGSFDPDAMQQFLDSFQRLSGTQPVQELCLESCHPDIAKTDNYSSSINFSHGFHMRYACSSCHPRFPHGKAGTVERPTMKQCMNCHGVRHNGQGVIASGECSDCHRQPTSSLRPASHTDGWAAKPHVEPGKKNMSAECAMCHTAFSCTGCHEKRGIRWSPASWDYDPQDGCLACHSDPTLRKASATGSKLYTVTGLDESAHADVSCQQCHIDFRYDDKAAPSKIWKLNVGYACADCHAKQKEKDLKAPVAEWKNSTHYAELQGGNVESATCASCHGGHFIRRTDTAFEQARVHGAAYRMCAQCHPDEYTSYDDYYHGAAYKEGAPDAPACWQCHASHEVLGKDNPKSTIYRTNVSKTCGQKGCHKGSEADFGEEAGELIHQKVEAYQDNPLGKFLARVRSWIS